MSQRALSNSKMSLPLLEVEVRRDLSRKVHSLGLDVHSPREALVAPISFQELCKDLSCM